MAFHVAMQSHIRLPPERRPHPRDDLFSRIVETDDPKTLVLLVRQNLLTVADEPPLQTAVADERNSPTGI
jgi:hypothetical protein